MFKRLINIFANGNITLNKVVELLNRYTDEEHTTHTTRAAFMLEYEKEGVYVDEYHFFPFNDLSVNDVKAIQKGLLIRTDNELCNLYNIPLKTLNIIKRNIFDFPLLLGDENLVVNYDLEEVKDYLNIENLPSILNVNGKLTPPLDFKAPFEGVVIKERKEKKERKEYSLGENTKRALKKDEELVKLSIPWGGVYDYWKDSDDEADYKLFKVGRVVDRDFETFSNAKRQILLALSTIGKFQEGDKICKKVNVISDGELRALTSLTEEGEVERKFLMFFFNVKEHIIDKARYKAKKK